MSALIFQRLQDANGVFGSPGSQTVPVSGRVVGFDVVWPEAWSLPANVKSDVCLPFTDPDEREILATVTTAANLVGTRTLRVNAALPPAMRESRELILYVYDTGSTTHALQATLSHAGAPPRLSRVYCTQLSKTSDYLYFSLVFYLEGTFSGPRCQLVCQTGSGVNPRLPEYVIDSQVTTTPVAGWNTIDLKIPSPLNEDMLFLRVTATDTWGVPVVYAQSLPVRDVFATRPPSRLDYDKSAQQVVNMLPLWTASRARDYLALAFDPNFTMKGPDWRYHPELDPAYVPYDFSAAPVSQRLVNAVHGQYARQFRAAIEGLERSLRPSRADVGAAGQVWTCEIDEDPSEIEQSLPASQASILSRSWTQAETDASKWLAAGEEVTVEFGGVDSWRVAGFPVSSLKLRCSLRVETDRGRDDVLISPADTPNQARAILEGLGSLGLVWRMISGRDQWYRLAWGWIPGAAEPTFGLYIQRRMAGVTTVIWRDFAPRYYPKNTPVVLELRDNGSLVQVVVDDHVVANLTLPVECHVWHTGLWASAPAQGVNWRPFWSQVIGQVRRTPRLIGTGLVSDDGQPLTEVNSEFEFLEAPPTRVDIVTATPPASGIFYGKYERDPERMLVEASKREHWLTWWCEGNQIVRGEDSVREALQAFWIWDPETEARPLTEYTLLSCTRHRRWLWVLGVDDQGQPWLFVVDPASSAPLVPGSCLWCAGKWPLPARGVATLVRSLARTEVLFQ